MTSLERRTRCTGRLPTGGRCRPAAGRRDGLGAAALEGRDEGLVPDRPATGREALVERRLGKPCRIDVMPHTIPAVVPADAMLGFRPVSGRPPRFTRIWWLARADHSPREGRWSVRQA